MKQIGMMIDLNRCIGCRTCVVACRNHHELIGDKYDRTSVSLSEILVSQFFACSFICWILVFSIFS